MSAPVPSIPVPTPVTGVKTPGGKPGIRLPVDRLQNEQPRAFDLYIQALSRWQQHGNETIDKDNTNGTGFFQVTGIHGVPYVEWQADPTQPVVSDAGYCTHRSVLFVPWHRPYLMLFEQILYEYAKQVAKEYTGDVAKEYEAALEYVRLPYWDWSSDSSLPKVTMQETISVNVPDDQPGTTKAVDIHNPLYSYRFTSDYAKEQNKEVVESDRTWDESLRCPNKDGISQQDVADKQMATYGPSFRAGTYNIMWFTDFAQFSCQAYKPKQSVTTYGSVEAMHNDVHNHTGTEDVGDVPTGNMTALFGSTFDPIFWLHHCHIDRLGAIWQAMNPGYTIDTLPSLRPRFTAPVGTLEGATTHLEPFHTSAAHDDKDYHIPDDTKEVVSIFDYGYYYPETPLEFIKDPEAMKLAARRAVNNLYGPAAAPGAPPRFGAPPEDKVPAKVPTRQDWQVFVRVRNFALSNAWGIHVFFGEPEEDSDTWFMSEKRVGTISILANDPATCANCRQQAADDVLVTGSINITHALDRELGQGAKEAEVMRYLTKNLTWRVAKDSKNVPITDDLGLVVGVSATEIEDPADEEQVPSFGEPKIFYEITAGKPGGLEGDHQL